MDEPMRHVVAGVHIGSMGLITAREIDSVLTVAEQAGIVGDGIHHRHQPLSYQNLNADDAALGAVWVRAQIEQERRVLIRSERGLQRPALVAGMVIIQMGGWFADAMLCLHRAHYLALSDFRFRDILHDYAKTQGQGHD